MCSLAAGETEAVERVPHWLVNAEYLTILHLTYIIFKFYHVCVPPHLKCYCILKDKNASWIYAMFH